LRIILTQFGGIWKGGFSGILDLGQGGIRGPQEGPSL